MRQLARSTAWILVVAAASFGAALIAFRVDRWLSDQGRAVRFVGPASRPAMHVDLPIQSPAFDFRAASRKLVPCVVSVDRLERFRSFFSDQVHIAQTGTGSGVILSADGYIVTNRHVVANADDVTVRLSDGRSFRARVVGSDARSDVALVKIDAQDLPAAVVGDSSKLDVGEWLIAAGNPLGYSNTISVGVVSSLRRTLETEGGLLVDAIQTDAAINSGNSGGPLANARGEVVGINTAIATDTGSNIGLGFAIPINRVKRVVEDLTRHGRVRYGELGAMAYSRPGLLSIDAAREQMKELTGHEPPRSGLVVRSVIPGSGADRAGVGELDVLIEVDGKPVELPSDLTKALIDRRAGESVKVKFWSKGRMRTESVLLKELL